MITTERIQRLADFIKWNRVFEEAGLNASTMRSAVKNGRDLRAMEVERILGVLENRGIMLTAIQFDLFQADDQATEVGH